MLNEKKLLDFAAATNFEIYDNEYGWMFSEVITKDSIEGFIQASENYAECSSKMQTGTVNGLPFVSWELVQAKKGMRRQSLTVLDFGDARVALDVYIDELKQFVQE